LRNSKSELSATGYFPARLSAPATEPALSKSANAQVNRINNMKMAARGPVNCRADDGKADLPEMLNEAACKLGWAPLERRGPRRNHSHVRSVAD